MNFGAYLVFITTTKIPHRRRGGSPLKAFHPVLEPEDQLAIPSTMHTDVATCYRNA